MATQQPPKLPTQSYLKSQARNQLQSELNRLFSNLRPMTPSYRPIPTFGASYFIPQQSLTRINQIASARPNINTSQLQQMAEQRTSLLTNPQIETLRQQIAAFKSLIPREQLAINEGYAAARNQMSQGVENMIASLVQAAERSGALRSGVYDALSKQVREDSTPLFDALEVGRTADISRIIGALEVEKQNAQAALMDLQANRKNLTKMQYDALYDEAVNRFRAAQQRQLELMNTVMAIESEARASSAALQQAQAQMYNEHQNTLAALNRDYLQRMAGLGFDQLRMLQEQLSNQIAAQRQQALLQWQDFLFGPQTRTPADAMKLLNQYRRQIEQTVGIDGFMELKNWLESQPPGLVNPRYVGPQNTSNAETTSNQNRQSGNVFINTLFSLNPSTQLAGRLLGIQPYNPISALLDWAFRR